MTNKDFIQKDLEYIWHPFTPLPDAEQVLHIDAAKGVYLHTTDGRKILDAISSWWVNLHGHSHPYIAEKISEQAKKLEHVIFAGFTHQPAIDLAEGLMKILPQNQQKIFYSDNGSTACEVALKMAFQYWYNQGIDKKKVIAFNGSYHGDTFGAMSVGDRSPFSAPFNSYLFQVEFIDLPNQESKTEQVIQRFEELAKTGEIAAFIYEPLVQGASGMRMYSPKTLNILLELAKKYQIICIADEVMTGFGRTGKWFASEYCANLPDIMCLSKGLTGGTMALGVTSCTKKILTPYHSNDLMKTFFHGHSFTANPLACITGVASLELLLQPECQENIQRIHQQHLLFYKEMHTHKNVLDIRIQGTILAVEIRTEKETGYFNEARSSLYHYFLRKNILLRPLGNVIYVLPPYVISNQELKTVYQEIKILLENI